MQKIAQRIYDQLLKAYISQLRGAYANIYIERSKFISPIDSSPTYVDETIYESEESYSSGSGAWLQPTVYSDFQGYKETEKRNRMRRGSDMLSVVLFERKNRTESQTVDALSTVSNHKIAQGLLTEIFQRNFVGFINRLRKRFEFYAF